MVLFLLHAELAGDSIGSVDVHAGGCGSGLGPPGRPPRSVTTVLSGWAWTAFDCRALSTMCWWEMLQGQLCRALYISQICAKPWLWGSGGLHERQAIPVYMRRIGDQLSLASLEL
eukprot:jgi/Ulvmu1/9153/UM005_0251.1